MVRRAAQEQPQNQANTSSQRCQNPAQSTAESNVSQPTQMPLQGSVSAQIPQQSYSQPIQAQLDQPINQPINQVYYAVPNATQPTAMSSLQQQVPTSASYSSPSAVVNQAAQCATMPMTSVQPGIAQPVTQPVMQQSVSQLQTPILLGTYAPKIDDKGRVALPAKFRAQLGGGFVMARGQERCVYVLPMVEFQRMTAQIQHTSMSNKSARDYLRVFLSGAVDEEPDKQGRIVVPPMLRDYASLGDEIVVIGVGTRAEIWNKSAWEAYLADREQGYADIADDVLPAVM